MKKIPKMILLYYQLNLTLLNLSSLNVLYCRNHKVLYSELTLYLMPHDQDTQYNFLKCPLCLQYLRVKTFDTQSVFFSWKIQVLRCNPGANTNGHGSGRRNMVNISCPLFRKSIQSVPSQFALDSSPTTHKYGCCSILCC